MSQDLIKKIKAPLMNFSFIGAFVFAFITGLSYVLLSDLGFSNLSKYLFLSIILSFGSGISMIFSENFKEKNIVFYILKGLSIALMIGFIIFIYSFKNSAYFSEIKFDYTNIKNLTVTLSLVFAYCSVFIQIVNTTSNILFKEK